VKTAETANVGKESVLLLECARVCASCGASGIACTSVIVLVVDPLIVPSDRTNCARINGNGGASSSCCCRDGKAKHMAFRVAQRSFTPIHVRRIAQAHGVSGGGRTWL
jgi:hypothetical protein